MDHKNARPVAICVDFMWTIVSTVLKKLLAVLKKDEQEKA